MSEFTISDNVDLVVLDVGVTRPDGSFAADLTREDFRVFEDGRPREIKDFSSTDVPVTLGLVVDNSGSMRPKRPEVLTAGLAFVRSSNPKDQFFVVNFNDSVTRGLPFSVGFTDDLQLLRKALYRGDASGQTALYDAIVYSLRHLELSPEQRRTLVVVSDGRDNVSSISFEGLMDTIRSSRATIYTIGLSDPGESELSPRILRKIASVSGGEYFEPKQLTDITATLEKISQDIRHRYVVTYVPDEVNDKREIRKVRVTASQNGRKLTVRTRTSYSIGRPSHTAIAGAVPAH
ncbi:MAG: VWA domain-containing protein [Acidobacteriota bacterium]|nr:VWA domain-containing protein [Acidobacteriota bacterium]